MRSLPSPSRDPQLRALGALLSSAWQSAVTEPPGEGAIPGASTTPRPLTDLQVAQVGREMRDAAPDRTDQSKALAKALAGVTMPIRWIVGELDPAREAVSRAAAATPHGDLVVVPASDHFQTFASAAFADAVAAFLSRD
jgi:pimeloyl-ACP methyl ester carboxylesterase